MKFLRDFVKINGHPPSASDLSAALAKLEVDAAGDDRHLDELEQLRRQTLLDGTDAELTRAEKAIEDHCREMERRSLQIAELRERVGATTVVERQHALTVERASVEREATEAAKLLRVSYPRLAGALCDLLAAVMTAEARVADVNAKLIAAGRIADQLEGVEARTIDGLGGRSILTVTSLLPIADATDGWQATTTGPQRIQRDHHGAARLKG